jgi:hypothetical protein
MVHLRNLTSSAVEVRSVRLSGTVLGVTLFDYETQVQATLPAGDTGATWTVDLDTRGLNTRATGLVPLDVSVQDADRATLATVSGTADVRGSLASVYGLFGFGLVLLTGLLVAVALLPLGRHAAPAQPWQRGLRFVLSGAAVGLVFVFMLSVLRIMAPSTPTDFGFAIGAALIAFGIAYVMSPAPTAPPTARQAPPTNYDWPRTTR